MKRKLLSMLLALLLVFSLVPLTHAEETVAPSLEDYNPHDYQKLAAFLEIADESGVKNGEKLSGLAGQSYDVNDPSTWGEWFFNWAETDEGLSIENVFIGYAELVGELDLSNCGSLKNVDFRNNNISAANVKGAYALETFTCDNNPIAELDLSDNTEAFYALSCKNCGLTELDIKSNIHLETLLCDGNHLTTLDASRMGELEFLFCYDNELTELNASHNPALQTLWCFKNELTSINISGDYALTDLNCFENRLTELDLFGCASLTSLRCYSNELSSLDVSRNTELRVLTCNYNNISELSTINNPKLERLYCIGNNISSIDVYGNTELTAMNCSENNISSLNVTNNRKLTDLYCSDNNLTELNVAYNPKLEWFACSNNGLTELDVSNCPELMLFNCSGNRLTELDLKNNTKLAILNCSGNALSSLDLSGIDALNPNLVTAEEGGTIGYKNGDEHTEYDETVFAQPDEGYEFVGWFNEAGELLSTEAEYVIAVTDYNLEDPFPAPVEEKIYIARFAPSGTPALPGDADNSGVVDTTDALLVLRCALSIEGDPEALLANCDMDGNGIIDTTDALLILRLALGIN